jgi:pyrimidine-nucleoside phosphorylase
VGLSLAEFRDALIRVGCALIGQTAEIAPADKLLYALRDVTATVESIPLITASILSKKIAEGIDALVLDVKCGRGAFMKSLADARRLAESLVGTGTANGVRTEALITAMDAPLGRAVGNALEVKESVEVLRGEGPADLEELSVALAARMLLAARLVTTLAEAETRIRAALSSGRGLAKLREIVIAQGGDPAFVDDPARLPAAPQRMVVRADRAGYVADVDAERLGRAAMVLGAGRNRVEDTVDHAVGMVVLARRGDEVQAGDAVAEVHFRESTRLQPAVALLQGAWRIGDAVPGPQSLVLDTVA